MKIRGVVVLMLLLLVTTAGGGKGKNDPDAVLRDILINYYNTLERHKHVVGVVAEHEEPVESPPEESDTFQEMMGETSLRDTVLEYVKDHISTRVWTGFLSHDQRRGRGADSRRPRGEIDGETEVWWEEQDDDPVYSLPPSEEYHATRRMVNRIFTASGFALSLVVLVVFFLACTYCWCISSPSKMLGAISTVLAIILLLHRLHEFFLVFPPEDLKRMGEAFVDVGGGARTGVATYEY